MTDRIVNMCRFLSLKTDDWNYSMVLWRSSQLYSCSFMYSTLSIITGTGNAFKAHFFDRFVIRHHSNFLNQFLLAI